MGLNGSPRVCDSALTPPADIRPTLTTYREPVQAVGGVRVEKIYSRNEPCTVRRCHYSERSSDDACLSLPLPLRDESV